MNNFKNKLSHFFLLNEEEEMQGEETEEVNEPSRQEVNQSAVASTKRQEAPNITNRKRRKTGGENVVAINQKQALQKPQITIVEPRLYSEVQEIADHLLANESIILNFRRMDHEQATKTIDFLMGVTYAVKGDIQRLDEELFICTPQSVTVNGSDLSEYTDSLL